MRVLAIRGSNLASLAGAFEVRLDAPPLDTAGLFAITGRTGAGKSTILDALCLALYDRVPRLIGGSGAEVGRADDDPATRLRANDVRNILRRGTGEGHAEVDFLGKDGRRYRARWSARRARGRAQGRPQPQEMGLEDLDSGEDLGGTKTEVLERIESRLGLTFDQFRRSVLLPQGDFAAFLKANAKERAELLERITGTEIYGRLSVAAHERERAEREQLRLVEQRLGERRPLDAEARLALDAQVAEAEARLTQLRARQTGLQQAQAWYRTGEHLTAEHADAQVRLAQADQDHSEAEPRRRDWERIRVLQPLRLPLSRLDQAANAESETHRTLDTARAEAEVAQTAVRDAESAFVSASQGLDAAVQARKSAGPQLAEARRLDTLIQDADAQLARARQEQSAAETARQAAQETLAALERRRDASDRALAAADAWLAERNGLQPVAAQWDAWERELGRYSRAWDERDAARQIQALAEADAAELARRREIEAASLRGIEVQREAADARSRALEKQAAPLDLGSLAAQRETLAARARDLDLRLRLLGQTVESRTRLASRQIALTDVQARRQGLARRRVEIDSGLGPLRAALAEAEAANERLLLASAERVDTLRGQLADGQPCPVCGSVDHPWAHQGADVLHDLSREQQDRVDGLRGRVETLTREQSAVIADSGHAERRETELQAEIDAEQSALDALLAQWSALPADPPRPVDPLEDGLGARIRAEREQVSVGLQKVVEAEEQGRALLKEIDQARVGIDRLRIQTEAAAKSLQTLENEITTNAQRGARAAEDAERADRDLAQITGLLTDPFAGEVGWQARLEADARGFVDDYRAAVAERREREAGRQRERETRLGLEPELAKAAAGSESGSAELGRCTQAVAEQAQALAGLQAGRAQCIEGRPVDAVEQGLESAVAAARNDLDAARAALEEHRRRLTAIDGSIKTQAKTLERQQVERAEALAQLEEGMQVHGVGLETLRQALEHDHPWVESERIALEALEIARRDARGLVEERARRLAEHLATAAPEWPPEVIDETLRAAALELEEAQARWGSLHGQREQDDRRRETAMALQAELELQRGRWTTWESLRGLIGSADGAKFRTFAQGLTLELLVDHANVHLQDLARRYELQRVPGAEMDLQIIDREMGDEVRGIQSLSGGEGFLVSLALALGLASLASDRVQVESLFVDEGFGALDADSLDMAIASLDALYGLGRQVGVISHVGTLVERIGAQVQIEKQGGGRSRLSVVCT